MTIGVVVNETKDIGQSLARKLAEAVAVRGGECVTLTGENLYASQYSGRSDALASCDVLICLGGDGTLIRTAREAAVLGTPILGVNLGSLGYLTQVDKSQADTIVDRIFRNEYITEERMMLSVTRTTAGGTGSAGEDATAEPSNIVRSEDATSEPGNSKHGEDATSELSNIVRSEDATSEPGNSKHGEDVINELAIGRGGSPHIIVLKIYIDGELMDAFPCDGVLVSTPTGSTAYALSAGGPVIDPELRAISVVPVCAHTIFSRPTLVSPDKEIVIEPVLTGSAFRASVSIDGMCLPDLRENEIIRIKKSERVTRIIRFGAENFYAALKNKLGNRRFE